MASGAEVEDEVDKLLVATYDLSERSLWVAISEALKTQMPLSGLIFENKFGKSIHVQEVDLEFLEPQHPKLQRLKLLRHSPITWFLFPYVNIILVTAWEAGDYKSSVRPKVRGVLDAHQSEQSVEGLSQWLIVYVRPPEVEQMARGPRKVFEKLQNDFNERRLERCVRLDFAFQHGKGSGMTIIGLADLERALKQCFKAAFQARQNAYEEEVKKLMSRRLDPGWSFPLLYLVKDSLALMLDGVGLLEDALREYYELEACYLESLAEGGPLAGSRFGVDEKGDDVATLMTASWKSTRQSVLRRKTLSEFKFRQYLFAARARLLIKLSRPIEVLERGLKFIQTFSRILTEKEQSRECQPLFKEVWSFSACISVASMVVKTGKVLEAPDVGRGGVALRRALSGGPASGARLELRQVEWDLGVCGLDSMTAPDDETNIGAKQSQSPSDSREIAYHCLLGHLYASAREELRVVGKAFEVHAPEGVASVGLAQADLLPSFTPICLSKQGGSTDSGKSFVMRKASSLFENLQHKLEASISHRSRTTGSSFGNSGEMSLDIERAPSWMTRAGLSRTPRRKAKTGMVVEMSPNSASSVISLGSEPQLGDTYKLQIATPTCETLQETTSARSVGSHNSMDSPISQHTPTDMIGQGEPVEDSTIIGDTYSARRKSASDSSSVPSRSEASVSGLGSWALTGDLMLSESVLEPLEPTSSPFTLDGGNWMSEWRLRRALSSDDLFEDLFVEVTLAASSCYSRAGRSRTSTVLRADVAPLLLCHGLVSASHQLYQMKSRMYAQEAWNKLRAHVLPQLVACLRGVDPTSLMAAALAYLSLPEGSVPEANRISTQKEMVSSAEIIERDLFLERHLVMAPALQIKSPMSRLSVYYGDSLEDSTPELCPPAKPASLHGRIDRGGGLQGAVLVNAGDIVELDIEVRSMLPEPLILTNVMLILTLSGNQAQQQTSVAPLKPQDGGDTELSRRMSMTTMPPSFKDSRRLASRTTSTWDGGYDRHAKWLSCPCISGDSPGIRFGYGVTKLVFKCHPMYEGLYIIQHILADLKNASICIPLCEDDVRKTVQPFWQSAMQKKKSILAGGGNSSGSEPSPTGEFIAVHVIPASQRITLSAMAPQESLLSNQPQWMGILIQGKSEEMRSGKLSISSVGQGPNPGGEAFVYQVRGDGLILNGEWVKADDNGSIALPDVVLGTVNLLVWVVLSFKKEVDLKGLSPEVSERLTGRQWKLEARVDYHNGCWRTHAMVLSIPVMNPFALETSQMTLKTGQVLITVELASCLSVAACLQGVEVLLGGEQDVSSSPPPLGITFPCNLLPGEALSLLFRLSKKEAEMIRMQHASSPDLSGSVSVKYSVETFSRHPHPVHCSDFYSTLAVDSSLKYPPPPYEGPPWSKLDERTNCVFHTSFAMDAMVGVDGTEPDLFKVFLLPPSMVTVGAPVALSWVLQRMGGEESSTDVAYSIVVEGMWQACVPLKGVVRVPSESGSSATIEAVFIPMSEGDLIPPRLTLNGTKMQLHASSIRTGAG